jgi:TetR/AcrR family transcriptional regulator
MAILDTKEKILEAARLEFGRHGLAGARVDRIAQNAAVNKAMIYYYFRSKENLYQAVIEDHFSVISEFLEKNIVSDISVEDVFPKISEFINSLFSERKNFLPIMLREIADGGERIKTAMTRLISDKGISEKIRMMIDCGIKDGRFREVDSKQAMISFLGMNLFYQILSPAINIVWEIEDETKFRQERPQAVADLFLNGLKKK